MKTKKVYFVKRTTHNSVNDTFCTINDLCFSTLEKAKGYLVYLSEIFAGKISDGGFLVRWTAGQYTTFCKIEIEDLDIDYKN